MPLKMIACSTLRRLHFTIKGYIYKELFKDREADIIQSPYRVIAVESFKTSIEMDPDGTFSESSRKNLKYLARNGV